ncbi:hypothetical protein TrVFT333_010700 [Trichoderma virens FT-333]|nr:hypothetical protein TrVFT333_010700 [Trichoderma virens FT-333]
MVSENWQPLDFLQWRIILGGAQHGPRVGSQFEKVDRDDKLLHWSLLANGGNNPVPSVAKLSLSSQSYKPGCPISMINKDLGLAIAEAEIPTRLSCLRKRVAKLTTL